MERFLISVERPLRSKHWLEMDMFKNITGKWDLTTIGAKFVPAVKKGLQYANGAFLLLSAIKDTIRIANAVEISQAHGDYASTKGVVANVVGGWTAAWSTGLITVEGLNQLPIPIPLVKIIVCAGGGMNYVLMTTRTSVSFY